MNINLGQRNFFYSTYNAGALIWLNLRNAIYTYSLHSRIFLKELILFRSQNI